MCFALFSNKNKMSKVLIEGTVPTGLELTALEEVQEKLFSNGEVQRGRIFFETFMDRIPEVLRFGSFERVYLVLLKVDNLLSNSLDKCENEIRRLVSKTDWKSAFDAWEIAHGPLPGGCSQSLKRFSEYLQKIDANEPTNLEADINDLDGPLFRVTCHREGKDFCFVSNQAAAFYGGEIHNCFHWKAEMETFDLELILRINKKDLIVSLPLNTHCASFRNLIERGSTCLKGSICYGLLQCCKLQTGDIVCDPMVGSGSVLLEAYTHWPQCQYIGGDIDISLSDICLKNRQFMDSKCGKNVKNNVEFFVWNAVRLPLKQESIDCVVTDLPFGKRCGSMTDNKILYPRFLNEISRVIKPTTGRAVLLTYDRRNMDNLLPKFTKYLTLFQSFVVNVGGLFSGVYVLRRTGITYL